MSISEPYLGNKQVMVTAKANVEKYGKDVTGARVVAETGSAGEELATETTSSRPQNTRVLIHRLRRLWKLSQAPLT